MAELRTPYFRVEEAKPKVLFADAVTTSETKISCCVDEKSLPAAETALKKFYGIN